MERKNDFIYLYIIAVIHKDGSVHLSALNWEMFYTDAISSEEVYEVIDDLAKELILSKDDDSIELPDFITPSFFFQNRFSELKEKFYAELIDAYSDLSSDYFDKSYDQELSDYTYVVNHGLIVRKYSLVNGEPILDNSINAVPLETAIPIA